jgi:hypothetical protein
VLRIEVFALSLLLSSRKVAVTETVGHFADAASAAHPLS